MASLKTIKNKYSLLTMRERFSLFQQAQYRNDQKEIDAVISESPQRILTAPDFCEMPEKIFRQDTVNLLSRLNYCHTFEYFIDAAVKTKDKKESELFSKANRLSAYLYIIETDAWQTVCDEIGLDANDFRELTSVMCLPVKMMNAKDKFIRDCAFDEDEASRFLRQIDKKSIEVVTIEEKERFYLNNVYF